MKKKTIILIILFPVLGLSCKKDFLEVIDKTKLLKQGYVVDLETTGHFMNGVYVQLAIGFANVKNIILYPEFIADNIRPRSDALAASSVLYTWSQTSDDASTDNGPGQWINIYKLIRSCNFVIEKANEYKAENEVKANNIVGQALSIRAWMHFLLVNMFAQPYIYSSDGSHPGVPYVRTSDIEEKINRQSVAEVYQNVMADLNEALKLLPTNETNKRNIFNYGAAKALLARVYLFKEDFAKAKNLSLEVLNSVPLMTIGYPNKLYTDQETEALFQAFPANSGTDNYNPQFLGYFTAKTFSFTATKGIAQLLRQYASDKRNAWVRDSVTPSNVFFATLITKFPKGVAGLSTIAAETDYYQTLFRSSEMVLTAAESYAKLNMDDSARYFVNQIRSRANIPVLPVTVTGNTLMDSIRVERQKEMAFDGIRMYDLLRWKKGINRIDAIPGVPSILPYPSDKAIAPIPISDVQLSGLQQNPSY